MKKLRFFLPLAVLAAAFAQTEKTPKLDALTTYLNLTDAQVQNLQQVRDQERQTIEAALQQLRDRESALFDLLQKGGADPAAVGKLVIDINAARKQIETTRAGFRDQARTALSADQKTKLQALQEAANLRPAIEQAIGMGLLAPLEGERMPAGPGFGPRRQPAGPEGAGRRSPAEPRFSRTPLI